MTDASGSTVRTARPGAAHYLASLLGAVALTGVFFLVLPLIQAINKPPVDDEEFVKVDVAQLQAPEEPPEEEELEEEEEPEPEPEPELTEEAPPLNLDQLELALNPSFGGLGLGGDFGVKLKALSTGAGDDEAALFSMAELDQEPRVLRQGPPDITPAVRRAGQGTVWIIFIVDEQGRVQNPRVWKAVSPVLDKAALDAVRKWEFEPGKVKGKPVRFPMRIPITFNKK